MSISSRKEDDRVEGSKILGLNLELPVNSNTHSDLLFYSTSLKSNSRNSKKSPERRGRFSKSYVMTRNLLG
jgi:hypothetical protein